jgi:hypothetical protein
MSTRNDYEFIGKIPYPMKTSVAAAKGFTEIKDC